MKLLVQPDMSLGLAEELLSGVKAEAEKLGIALSAMVVDRAGQPVASCRMDGAQVGAFSISSDKAYTAVAFGQPTANWAASTTPSGSDWGMAGSLGGRCIVFAGGVPVFSDGALIGALGVSGAASTIDQSCAEKAVVHAGYRTTSAG